MDTRAHLTPARAFPVLVALFFNVVLGPLTTAAPVAAADGVSDYSQCQIGNPSSGLDCESWINGILNSTHNNFSEDEVVPQRLVIDFDDTDTHSITLSYMARKTSGNSAHAYDYLATWNHTYVNALRCQDLQAANCVGGAADTFPIPSDGGSVTPGGPQPTSAHELPQAARQFVMYGADITSTSAITHSVDPGEDGSDYGNITINFDVTDTDGKIMLLFGGHLASGFGPRGWGAGLGAAGISGGPYHIRVTAMDGASIGNRDNQIMSDAIEPLPGLGIAKTTSTPVISAGDVASYTITVTNSGQGDATGVVVTDTLDSGVTWADNSASCTISSGFNLSCGPLTIAANSSFAVTVTGTTDLGECPSISNTASFTSTNGGSGDTTANPTIITVNCPTIRVEKTPDEDAQNPGANDVTAGDAATFAITVYNDGLGSATGVNVTDDLPGTGWSVVAAQTTLTNCVVNNPGLNETLSCGSDSLGAGLNKKVTVTKTTVHPTDCGEINNTANVTTGNDGSDSDGGNVDVLCAAIRVEKTPDEATDTTANDINAGEDATFTVVVHNDGTGEARGVTLFDDLPETTNGWAVVAADTTLSNCAVTDDVALGEVLDCGPDDIGAGSSLKVTLTTETTADDCGSLDNTATATAANDGSDTDEGNVDVLCPDLTIEKTPDGEVISAGEEISFTVTVTNNGAGSAANVVIDDVLPAGFAWAEDPDLSACAITLGALHCDVGDLAPTASFSVTVSAPTNSEDCSETAYLNTAVADADNHAQIDDTGDVTIECPDLEVTKTPDGEVIDAGEEISFTITVTNHGPGTAFAVTLDDVLPAGFAWAEDPDLSECAITLGDLHCGFGDMAATDTFSVTVSAPTDEHDCADNAYVNTAVAGATNHADVDDTGDVLIQCPDIEVSKTPDGEVIDAGDEISFTITVTNAGPATATAVTLDDDLPAGFDWAEDPDLLECEITLGALHCDIGDMAATDTFSVTVSAPTSAEDCAENAYVNTAVADADNHASVDDTGDVRIDCPDVTVDKEAVASPISAGEQGQFTIEVTNDGPGLARDVVMTDTAPAGTVWTVLDDGGASCSSSVVAGQQSITCNIGDLADNASVTILIGYATVQADCGPLDNSAGVEASNEPAANTENNSDEASIIVECPGLNFAKTADADPIDAGEEASFTLSVWNIGPGEAFDVTLHDDLPAGLAWDFEVVSGDATDADCSVASSLILGGVVQMSIDCSFGTLGISDMAGGIVIRVFADTTRADCGLLENEAWVDAPNADRIDRDASILVKCPTIALEKANDAVGSVLPGTEVTYTLTLTVDDGPASDVEVIDALPVGLENPTDISDGGVFDATSGTITWSLGDLADGEYTLTYQAVVADDVAHGEELVNAAAATSPNSQCPDLETLGPECEDDSTVVVRVPTLVIDKVADAELITITGPNDALVATPAAVTWTLTYTLTNGPVTNAVITDEVPVGFEFLDASDGGTLVDGVVTWTFPTLTESGSVTFRTTVDPETISRVAPTVNVAVIDSDETPEDEGQDSVTVTREEELGGTPTPRPSLPNTATGIGLNGEPITVPIELLAAFFIGSLGALALANVKSRNRRR